MLKKLTMVALVPENNPEKYVFYFLQNENKFLISIPLSRNDAKSILDAQYKPKNIRPSIYDTCRRLVVSTGASVLGLVIYKYLDSVFYAYVRVEKQKDVVDIDCSITDGLCLCFLCGKDILIESEVLNEVGISVSDITFVG